MKIIAYVLCLLIISSSVSAGTLVSGSTVDVKSNYDGFSGLSLIGEWRSTPSVNDRLSITNAQLPAPYGLRDTIEVDVSTPTIEQVFRVNNQQKLERLVTMTGQYYYLNGIGGKSASQLCEERFQTDRNTRLGGKPILAGTSAVALIANTGCKVTAVLVDGQQGWIGTPTDQGIYFEQTINLDGVGTLRLARNEKENILVAKIDNVGRATLLNFNSWTNADLDNANVYAYHGKNALGSDQWKPFADTSGLANYNDAIKNIAAQDGVTLTGGYFGAGTSDFDSVRRVFEAQTSKANSEVTRLSANSASLPSQWGGTMGGAVRYAGNDIIVPLNKDKPAFVSSIQLVLAGSKFGLFIPTGEPKIVSAGSAISFDETGFGNLAYTVKNVGTDTGSFVLSGTCGSGQVVTDPLDFSLKAGEQKSGTLRHTAKSQSFDKTEKFTCLLTLKETQTTKKDTRAYSVEVVVKQQCTDGEETTPTFDSAKQEYSVYVLDSSCSVKSTKTCAISAGSFVKENGAYVCKASSGGIVPPPTDEGGEFRAWLFWTAIGIGSVLGAIVSFFAVAKLRGVSGKARLTIFIILFVIITVAVALGVGYLARAVSDYFTLSIAGGVL